MKLLDGLVAQVVGDGGDAVALIDAEAGDGQVGVIEPDEGDIGAVQGGDEGEAAILAEEHLAREIRGDGMRNRVVDVQQVQLVVGRDLSHAGGEGQVVGRVFEEGIIRDGDFVEGDVLLAAAEAEGLRIGDEVDLMAGRRQLDTELGGDNAAAAVGGIAGDSDLHREPGYRVQVAGYRIRMRKSRERTRVRNQVRARRGWAGAAPWR